MYCKKCGTENPDGSKFCSGCGTALSQASNTENKTLYCENCGTYNYEGSELCSGCGMPLVTKGMYSFIWHISRWKRIPVSVCAQGDQVEFFWTDKREGTKNNSFNRQELVAANIETGVSVFRIISRTICMILLIFIIFAVLKYNALQFGLFMKFLLCFLCPIAMIIDFLSAWKTHLDIRLRNGEKYCFYGDKSVLKDFRDKISFRLSGVEKRGGEKSVSKIVVSIICLIIVVISGIIVTTSFNDYEVVRQIKEANGSSVGYSQISYGYAYDAFLSNATWSAEVDEAGNDVVVVRGGCEFLDEPVTAVVKFTLNDAEGTFSMTSLLFDGESQGELMRAGMQEAVFESAAENLGIEKDS